MKTEEESKVMYRRKHIKCVESIFFLLEPLASEDQEFYIHTKNRVLVTFGHSLNV